MTFMTFVQNSLYPRGNNASKDEGFWYLIFYVALFLIHSIWEQVSNRGIYNPNHQSGRWEGLLSMGAPDSPVRQPRHPTIRVRPLELWHVGPPDSHCSLFGAPSGAALTLRALSAHCSVVSRPLNSTVVLATVAPLGTPDSLVQHRTVRWIIAEWLPKNPKLSSSEWISPVHRTLSGAPDQSSLRLSFAPFCLNPFLDFLLVCVEPLAPVDLII
jgi:hypothetical protein